MVKAVLKYPAKALEVFQSVLKTIAADLMNQHSMKNQGFVSGFLTNWAIEPRECDF